MNLLLNPLSALGFGFAGMVLFWGVVIYFGLRWPPVRRFILFVLGLLPAAFLCIVGVLAIPLWRPVGWATDLILRFVPLDKLVAWTLRAPERLSKTPLLKGDRRAHAERIWGPGVYPDLYQAVPADLARPPWEDGRLLGGHPITWLADRHLTDALFRSAIRAGFKAGVLVFLLGVLLLLLSTLFSVIAFFPALFRGDRPVLEQWPGEDPVRASAWSLLAGNLGHAFGDLLKSLGAVLVQLPAAAVTSVGVAILIALLLLRGWMQEKSAPYELVTKDAEVRWPYRIESRNLLRETYRRQLRHVVDRALDRTATYRVGTATGTLRVRGDLAAPLAGQAVMLDAESLFQHTLVFGGTGEGKTRALLRPLIAQVLADRRFGAFVADAKGDLWREVERIAGAAGRADDVVVVGSGPGQLGVDLTGGLTPSQIAATLRSVMAQTGGSGEGFWSDLSANIMRHALTVGAGYALTPAGEASIEAGLNPYSLWWAYQAVVDEAKLLDAVAAIEGEHQVATAQLDELLGREDSTPDEAMPLHAKLSALGADDLIASCAYLKSAWRDMAKETKTGIVAGVTQLLDGFSSSPELRQRFAAGRSEGTVDLRAALDGKLVLIALSSIEEGLTARLATILLKTSLYREARRREGELRGVTPKRDPQDAPCLVVMDEVQELVTVDPSSGLSDATFWNVARTTGLAGLFATQTLSALKQSMGEAAAENFVQQARSKVFFRSEEQGTIDFACWCAGEFERNRVYEAGQRESLDYRLLIDGWDPLTPIDEAEQLVGGPAAFFGAAGGLLNPGRAGLGTATARATYTPDLRFIPTNPTGGTGPGAGTPGNAASMGARQAAFWRAEDLSREYRSNGNDLAPALASSDLLHMGRWHAFAHIQRAGSVRQDIILVDHDLT